MSKVIADRERLRALIIEKSLSRGQFILASGATSSYYLDIRKISMDPEGAFLIANLMLDILAGDGLAAVGGPVLGAAPIVGAIAAESFRRGHPLPVFLVRKEAKSHGTGQLIEGILPATGAVALVEDVVTSAGSVLQAIDAVEAAGSRVSRVVCVVDRAGGGKEAIEARGIAFTPLFPVADLLTG
ncbi:MAG: orotate phosphoribosyltransferase [Candidatus Eisenbacteria bacterium]|nr:orotate phosphoribosyltransferase [Candidatus Eisenbacteria bacterium]